MHCINGIGLKTYTIISIEIGMRGGMEDDLGMAWDRKKRWKWDRIGDGMR